MAAYPLSIDLSSLNGANGFRLDGVASGEGSGTSVASAGDLNGDGYADLIIGAPNAAPGSQNFAGSSYVVFGKASGFASALALGALNGTDGFRLDGNDDFLFSGSSVASAGDVNGDGLADLIIGTPGPGLGNYSPGYSYVVFGKVSDFGAAINLASLNGTNGFRVEGVVAEDASGSSVSSAGDVNGDGFADLIIGAPDADSFAGSSYVMFGKASGFSANFDLSTLNGANGFRLDGAAGDRSGTSVAAAGDVNGDGYGDLIVGAFLADPGGHPDAGSSYVVFGKASGFASALDLGALTGVDGFRLDGGADDDRSGISVASAGDVNGDGFDDLIVGANGADPDGNSVAGSSYVVFGKASGFSPALKLASLSGADGFRLDGVATGDSSGHSVAAAGDVNGDGFNDLIVGAGGADPGGDEAAGSIYVVFGKASGFSAAFDLGALDGTNGFRLDGVGAFDVTGASVASAGDVNGDGLADLILGAYAADQGGDSNSGSSYVVFGMLPQESVTRTGSAIAQAIYGGAGDDVLSGLDGGDTLTANAGDDQLIGGVGNDRLFGGSGADQLSGGSGNDVIDSGAGDDVVDGGSGTDTLTYAAAKRAVRVDLGLQGYQDTGGSGFDSIWGVEALVGSRFGDSLQAGSRAASLSGGVGADTLTGGGGADVITGGKGGDLMDGGLGADRFVFASIKESKGNRTGADTIAGVAAGDLIDLSKIDADTTTAGDQSFVLQAAFTGIPRQLVLTYKAGLDLTQVRGDVNGDGAADFSFYLAGDLHDWTGFVL